MSWKKVKNVLEECDSSKFQVRGNFMTFILRLCRTCHPFITWHLAASGLLPSSMPSFNLIDVCFPSLSIIIVIDYSHPWQNSASLWPAVSSTFWILISIVSLSFLKSRKNTMYYFKYLWKYIIEVQKDTITKPRHAYL